MLGGRPTAVSKEPGWSERLAVQWRPVHPEYQSSNCLKTQFKQVMKATSRTGSLPRVWVPLPPRLVRGGVWAEEQTPGKRLRGLGGAGQTRETGTESRELVELLGSNLCSISTTYSERDLDSPHPLQASCGGTPAGQTSSSVSQCFTHVSEGRGLTGVGFGDSSEHTRQQAERVCSGQRSTHIWPQI